MKPGELQAIFFDFDGVILDSTDIKTETFKQMFEPYGPDVVEQVLKHHLQHGGISRVEKIRHYHQSFLGKTLSEEEISAYADSFSNAVKKKVIESPSIAGAEAFIKKVFKETDLYIISGTPMDELLEITRERGYAPYFFEILGSPTKKPEHVRRIIRSQQLDPALCLFIGDAFTDYNTALETGIRFIGIQGEVPFPEGTIVLPDCTGLEDAIAAMSYS